MSKLELFEAKIKFEQLDTTEIHKNPSTNPKWIGTKVFSHHRTVTQSDATQIFTIFTTKINFSVHF